MTFERYPELDTLLLANPGAVRDYKPEGEFAVAEL